MSAVTGWFESVTPLAQPFAQIDVDQLGEQPDWLPSNLVGWSVALFEALCSVAHQAKCTHISTLAIPLAYSPVLDCSEPDVDSTFASEWTELEVPGLYLIRDSEVLGFDAPEEYRRVLSSSAPAGASTGYYRCWRTGASEFARALYFLKLPLLREPC